MLSLIAAMILAAAQPPADGTAPVAPPPSAQGGPAKPAPLPASQAVDANGVPAWAKRKHRQPVQSCETRPNIGVETWRQRYDSTGKDLLKPKPPTFTCH
ncbi:MAG: hypothetical protein JNK30_21485 [Phenylobacterium sp.]|uniref:hypothetical protein n=1 Tax=Phenylobacterium sp. TaxID=1871053 RepID=UPI001A39CD33|nr:hypothetical protein [Phenylobacterium sp.]MBL8773973.1 hypothetical protein [Phenylobacterium sp.]